MSIAIMACRKLVGQCAGTGCFDAYNNLTDTFESMKIQNLYYQASSIVVVVIQLYQIKKIGIIK